MSVPVEAQSLSALTNLFANPPQYPRNPTHQVHEPLILYIVRVPGSRDVFLSPLKPPTKSSISLEAIQSSLYYFHVNTAEDEEVKRSIDQQRKSEELSKPPTPVARKPLPPTPPARHPWPPPAPAGEPQQYHPSQPLPTLPTVSDNAYQAYGSTKRGRELRLDTSVNAGLHWRPTSSKGLSTIHYAAGDYAPSPTHTGQPTCRSANSRPAYPKSGAGNTSSSPGCVTSENTPESHSQNGSPPPSSVRIGNSHSVEPNFPPVTIIRRDPATGSQWNIGTITLLDPTFSGSNLRPVLIELNTPGYGRFVKGASFDTPRPGSAGSDVASIKRAIESINMSPASATSPEASVIPFHRTVDFRKMAMSDLRRTIYRRTNSFDSMERMDSFKSGPEKNVLAFASPWQGTCTFVNAIDGKSLKIKHTISSSSPVAQSITANVGELRFNLGWSFLSNIKDSKRRQKAPEPDKLPISELLKTRKENVRKSLQHVKNRSRESFHGSKSSNDSGNTLADLSNIHAPITNHLNDERYSTISTPDTDDHNARFSNSNRPDAASSMRPTSSEDNDDQEDRLSLRLGREKAGGGFSGHSAKLGKLIIEDEGLKMCDLVVGAAMGVWWQHYKD